MDPSLMSPEERRARANIVVGAYRPITEAGRAWHDEHHENNPKRCGSAGCVLLGRILAIEREMGAWSEEDRQAIDDAMGLPR